MDFERQVGRDAQGMKTWGKDSAAARAKGMAPDGKNSGKRLGQVYTAAGFSTIVWVTIGGKGNPCSFPRWLGTLKLPSPTSAMQWILEALKG
jgi:hypothetical protein